MAKLDPKRLRRPWALALTVTILLVSALVGAYIGQFAIAGTMIGTSILLGPIAWFTALPLIFAQFAAALIVLLFVLPFWALLGGWWFASRARGVSRTDLSVEWFADTHPIHRRVNALARQLELPPIKWVGWFPEEGINAFARGIRREEAVIAFSAGAIERLSRPQLDAVMAHELAHVANHDMARMTYAHGMQDALTWFLGFRGLKQFARWVFTPIAQIEIQRFSRQREFWADAVGAALVGRESMIGVLQAVDGEQPSNPRTLRQAQFMFHGGLARLLSSHPAASDRIRALEYETFLKRLPYRRKAPANETAAAATANPASEAHETAPKSTIPVGRLNGAIINGVTSFGS